MFVVFLRLLNLIGIIVTSIFIVRHTKLQHPIEFSLNINAFSNRSILFVWIKEDMRQNTSKDTLHILEVQERRSRLYVLGSEGHVTAWAVSRWLVCVVVPQLLHIYVLSCGEFTVGR